MSTNISAQSCEFCGRRAEIAVTAFDPLVPLGPPRPACRFCLGRPHRQETVTEGAHTIRLEDLASGRTATGQPGELMALLSALTQQRGERTITAAIRVQSYQATPIELSCAGCGGTVNPSKGGIAVWRRGPEGRWTSARIFHARGCLAPVGETLEPGCWEELDQLAGLDLTRFDEESLGYLTDVEIAWQALRTG